MRILSVVGRSYYGQPHAIEPMFVEFTEPLRRMGHSVSHFDHMALSAKYGPDRCGATFVNEVYRGRYDLVFYQTAGRDHMPRQAIADAARRAPILAWNSDDDWKWESYTSKIAPYFTYMITTYPHVYERGKAAHPNLILSQWGCLDRAGRASEKPLDFSFVGQIYRNRVEAMRKLRQSAGLKVFGLGAARVKWRVLDHRKVRSVVSKIVPSMNQALSFSQVYDVWSHSKISYTPLAASRDSTLMQIKGRVFQMGLSNTLMLAPRSMEMPRYYEPDREFVQFDDLADCAQRVKYYLKHDEERERIVMAYAARTRGEHLWEQRFTNIFRDAGLQKPVLREVA